MDAQREKMVERMEKNKNEKVLTQEQKERIWKREEEAFLKKQEKILSQKRPEPILPKSKMADKYKDKVESKLLQETKAIQEKKRDKFDSKTMSGRDAITMGGNLLGV